MRYDYRMRARAQLLSPVAKPSSIAERKKVKLTMAAGAGLLTMLAGCFVLPVLIAGIVAGGVAALCYHSVDIY